MIVTYSLGVVLLVYLTIDRTTFNQVATWNQLFEHGNTLNNWGTWQASSSYNGEYRVIKVTSGQSGCIMRKPKWTDNHKYLTIFTAYVNEAIVQKPASLSVPNGFAGDFTINSTVPVLYKKFLSYPYSHFDENYYFNSFGNTILYVKNAQLFDLTAMYGSGNEPTTYKEFVQRWNGNYYEYNTFIKEL